MTPAAFKAARQKLGLSQTALGQRLGPPGDGYSLRAVQSWEKGERSIPPAVKLLLAQFTPS